MRVVREGRRGRVVSAVAIFLTAVALQQACTVTWAHATASSGARFELSAVGLSRADGALDHPRTDCRWWPKYGNIELCAPSADDRSAYDAMRRAYPFLQVALWLAVASVLLQALRVPRRRVLQAAVPAASAMLTTVAVYAMMGGARGGLTALRGLDVTFDGRGFWLAVIAAVLSAASAVVLMTTFVVAEVGDESFAAPRSRTPRA
jgi:hypothetical protein